MGKPERIFLVVFVLALTAFLVHTLANKNAAAVTITDNQTGKKQTVPLYASNMPFGFPVGSTIAPSVSSGMQGDDTADSVSQGNGCKCT